MPQKVDPTRQTDYSVIAPVYERRYRQRYAETARSLDAPAPDSVRIADLCLR